MEQIPASPSEASQLAVSSKQLSAYGYYVLSDGLFYAIEPYSIKMEFGFNKLGGLKYAPASSDFKIVVFRPDWYYEHTSFFAQDLDIVNHDYTKRIEPKIVQVAEHVYELEFPALEKGQLLVIRDYNNLYGIGIGSISDALIELFNTTKAPPHAVIDNLKKALKSFPDNLVIQALKGVWEYKVLEEKTEKVWNAVQEKLQNYKGREDREGKLVLADDVLHEIQYYLSLADNTPRKVEAEALIAEIESYKSNKPQVEKQELPDISQLAEHVVCYSGDTFTLTMVDVGEEVLLRFKGIPNEYDNVVIRHKKQIQNEATGAFILQTDEINGENWNTFCYENDGWGGLYTYVYPPQINNQVYIQEGGITEDTPLKLYKDYSKQ
ncbi:hypothetical protein SAMN04487906_0231 [Zhouia amylolytica]|uniref:Uncharacterized protein n=1 Tax=Zhouia amylolytica TaxID=376730 RepID=A0A1I6PCN9_9FLAO|nr:hypothetical protein [Zhouia amylolytica]MCQ0111418.1 hypothetical protein [Zhouia amylolytica]SFS37974.1 hypothetical protein SAMN04487906_0231 [Zhouia amylolytica]